MCFLTHLLRLSSVGGTHVLTRKHSLSQTRQDSLLLDFPRVVSGGDQARDAAVATSWVGHEKGEGGYG